MSVPLVYCITLLSQGRRVSLILKLRGPLLDITAWTFFLFFKTMLLCISASYCFVKDYFVKEISVIAWTLSDVISIFSYLLKRNS